MKSKICFTLLTILILNGCVLSSKQGSKNTKTYFLPEINEISNVSLGERMMFTATGWNVDCFTPIVTKKRALTPASYTVELTANKKYCSDSSGSNSYKSTDSIGSFYIEKIQDDGSSNFHLNGYSLHYVNFNSHELDRKQEFFSVPNSLQQTIEYMGSDGNIVRFVYSEFSNNMARSAFNREFTVDLSKGNTLNFKGAKVEIINATNTTIEYKVLKYFN